MNAMARIFRKMPRIRKRNEDQLEKGKEPPFQWTQFQTTVLIDCLCELAADTMWKADCGFKKGYLTHLELMLNERLQGQGIKISHIEGRMKTLRKCHGIISDMLAQSGFAWDYEHHQVSAETEALSNYVKHHPGSSKYAHHPCPYYQQLANVFGKDRATREGARNADEEEEELMHQPETQFESADDIQNTQNGPDRLYDNSVGFDGYHVSYDRDATPSSGRQRRRAPKAHRTTDMDERIGRMADAISNMGPTLNELVRAMSTEKEDPEMYERLPDEFRRLGVSMDHYFTVTTHFGNNPNHLRMFLKMGDENKKAFIASMLRAE